MSALVMAEPCSPVLIAKDGVSHPASWRDILCVTNLDGTDSALVQTASDLAFRSGARLHLTHAVPEVSEGLLSWSIMHPGRPLSEAVARERILALASQLPAVYSASVSSGSDRREVLRAARAVSADLVVLRSTDPNLRALLKRLDCPVLAVSALLRRRDERTASVEHHEPEYAAVKQQ